MKFGAVTSTVMHVAILTWGMFSLSAPEIQQIELSGVEIDFETSEVSQPVKGEEKADVKETPAPKPTKKPEKKPEPEAKHVGDSKVDEASKKNDNPGEKVVEKTATAPEPDQAVKQPDKVPTPEPKDEPTPATELAALSDPATPVTETPPVETPETPKPTIAEQQIAALPNSLPVPVSRPKPPKPNTAKTQERKQPKDKPSKKAKDAKKSDDTNITDLIKNNKTTEEASSGGKKKSTKVASRGTDTSSFATKLSRREEDNLISQISRCSTGQAGQSISNDLKITIIMELNPDGTFKITPKGKASGGTKQEQGKFTRDALRYTLRCAPYDFLPQEKYETWKNIVVTFHPSKMFQ